MLEQVNHPPHYGGADNPYETIKVIEAWGLNFNLGNAIKYISRSASKGSTLIDLQKARWYLDRECQTRQRDDEATRPDTRPDTSPSPIPEHLIDD